MLKNCLDCQKEINSEGFIPLCQKCLKYWATILLSGISLITGLLALIFWKRFN